jgi:hypothetical protein
VFHQDQTPSLSIDIDRGLFNCFACGAKGGARKFAELVGDGVTAPPPARPAPPETPLARMRREALELARHQPWLRPGVVDLYREADLLRAGYRLVAEARAIATASGISDAGFDVLSSAARLETDMVNAENDLDDIIRRGSPW